MKKENIRLLVVAVVVLIAYNFAVFMIPCLKTPAFWISWGYTLLSFGVSGYAIYTAFIKKTDAKSRFYGFPIARIGVVYLVLQVALGGLCMAFGDIIPWWAPTVLFAIGLALAVIGLISAETVVDQIETQDEKLKKDVSAMRGLTSKVSSLARQYESAALKALAEEFRYSDPVSSDAIVEAETELAAAVEELQAAVVTGENVAVEQVCRKVSVLLAERNRLCKQNKG